MQSVQNLNNNLR